MSNKMTAHAQICAVKAVPSRPAGGWAGTLPRLPEAVPAWRLTATPSAILFSRGCISKSIIK